MKSQKILVKGIEILTFKKKESDYISLTDMAKFKDSYATGIVISNWLSTKYTIQFIGAWEQLHNPNFNVMEFNNIRNEAGSNGFILSSSRWIEKTKAIGIKSSAGRYGGTYAHKDISKKRANMVYASEAEVLNVALFGLTSREWRDKNQNKDGNIRDFADVTQLVVLANLEGINAELIRQSLSQSERLVKLNQIAIVQMRSLLDNKSIKKLT